MTQCRFCKKEFIPNKYHPNQQVCTQPECQRKRQLGNEKNWQLKNPDYFKLAEQDPVWRQSRQIYQRLWKSRHKEILEKYKESYRPKRKAYMRDYMRKYRAKNVNREKS